MKQKKQQQRFWLTLLVLVIAGCGALVIVGYLAVSIPHWAEDIYGAAAPTLSPRERLLWGTVLLMRQDALLKPANPAAGELSFKINAGESAGSILGRLEQAGLVTDVAALRVYLQFRGWDTSLQAGTYSLSAAMPPVAIAAALQDATPEEVTLYVLAGWRIEEVAAALPAAGLSISPQEFLQAANAAAPFGRAEGFLMPGAYLLRRTASANEVAQTLINAFEANVDQSLRDGFARQGLTLYEAVTLASIVEREAITDEEMPLIASVYLNRLQAGMKLDADPTVQYAIGSAEGRGWWAVPLTRADLQIDSPYNTYLYAGLPPAPIASPGLAALRAVAFPAQSPYFYFRAACDGSGKHVFAVTYEEHLANACR